MISKPNKKIKTNKGMTYVELIVVLSIFSILSSVAIFNYGAFQDKVDIKNLGSDVALQIIQAQKSALSGLFPTQLLVSPSTWKPSYGVYFFDGSGSNQGANSQNFIYFADLDYSVPPQNGLFDDSDCTGECIGKISITKNNSISKLEVLGTGCPGTVNNLTIAFKRPDSSAIISSNPVLSCAISYAQITVSSPKLSTAVVKIYPSGRVEVK